MGPVVFPLDFDNSRALATVNQTAAAANRAFSGLRNTSAPFDQIDKSAKNFNRTLSVTNSRILAFAAETAVLYGMANAFKAIVRNAMQVERAIAGIQVNIRATSKELSALTSSLFDIASITGQSFGVAAEAAAEFGRQGLKLNTILKATKSALVLTQTTGMSVADSVSTLTAAVNTFGKYGETYESIVNKMAAADTSFAVSSKDLSEGLRRVGSTATDANVSFDELLATITAVQQRTARGGSVIGNSLKTIFTRLQRSRNVSVLEGMGIQTRDAEGNFVNQIGVLKQLAEQYDKMSGAQQAAISELIGGVFQINIVKSLFQDLGQGVSTYSQALDVVKRSQNDAFIKGEFLSNTNIARINTAKNLMIEFGDAIGKLGLNDAAKSFISDFNIIFGSINDSLGKEAAALSFEGVGQSFVKGIIGAVSGPGLAIALRGVSQLAASVLSNTGRSIGGAMFGGGARRTQEFAAARSAESKQKLAQVNRILADGEQKITQEILRGNSALAQRLALLSRINGTVSPVIGGKGSSIGAHGLAAPISSGVMSAASSARNINPLAGGPGSFGKLSDKQLITVLKSEGGIRAQGAAAELSRRGVLNDPKAIYKGLPLSAMGDSAVRAIAKNSSGKFSALMIQGAQKERASRVAPKIEARQKRQLINPALVKRKTSMGAAGLPEIQAAAPKSYRPPTNVNYESAQIAFSDWLQQNPTASDRDIRRRASLVNKAFGVSLNEGGKRSDLNQARRLARKGRNQRFAGRVGGAAFGASIGGQVLGDVTGNEGLGSAVSSVGTFAALGASFGPAGAAVGGLVGGIAALAQASKDSAVPLKKFEELMNSSGAEVEKQNNAFQNYFSALSRQRELLSNPASSLADIEETSRQKMMSLNDLPLEARKAILSANGDDQARRAANDQIDTTARASSLVTAMGGVVAEANKQNASMGRFFRSLGQGGVSNSLRFNNFDNIKSAIETVVSSVNVSELQKIRESGGDAGGAAFGALQALDSGDFKSFVSNLRDTGMFSGDAAEGLKAFEGVLNKSKGELFKFNKAFVDAAKTQEEITKLAEEDAKRMKRLISSVADIATFTSSLGRRESTQMFVREQDSRLRSSRLGLVMQEPGLSGGTKNFLTLRNEMQENESKRLDNLSGLSVSVGDLVKNIFASAPRQASEVFGQNFVADSLGALSDPERVPELLDQINGRIGDVAGINPSIVEESKKLVDLNRQQSFELSRSNQLAQEQYRALESINRKTRFDDLIKAMESANAQDIAFGEMDLNSVRRQLFENTPEQKKARQEAVNALKRTGDSSKLTGIVSQRADLAREFLKLSDEKMARGEAVDPKEIANARSIMSAGTGLEAFSIQAEQVIAQIRAANSPNARLAVGAINKARGITAFNAESNPIQGNARALEVLSGVINRLPAGEGPRGDDRRRMEDLFRSLQSQTQGRVAQTDEFQGIRDAITGKDYGGIGTEIVNEVLSQLDRGNLRGAADIVRKNRSIMPDQFSSDFFFQADRITSKTGDRSLRDAFSGSGRRAAGLGDISGLGGSLPSDNPILQENNTNLENLNISVRALHDTMLSESRVAQASAKVATIQGEIDAQEKERGAIQSILSQIPQFTDREATAYSQNVGPARDRLMAASKYYADRNPDLSNSLNTFASDMTRGTWGGEGFESARFRDIESALENRNLFSESDQNRVQMMQRLRRDMSATSLTTGEANRYSELAGKTSLSSDEKNELNELKKLMSEDKESRRASLEESADKIREAIDRLTKQGEESAARADAEREKANNATKPESGASNQSQEINVNVSGLEGADLSKFQDGIKKLMETIAAEKILSFNSNPRLFNAQNRGTA